MEKFIKAVKEMREHQKLRSKGMCSKGAVERKEYIVDSMIRGLETEIKTQEFDFK